MNTLSNVPTVANEEQRDQWFNDLIASINVHWLQLEQGMASAKLKEFYDIAMSDNYDKLAFYGKNSAQLHFVSKMIKEYTSLIKEINFSKLAFAFNDSEVLVWVEIQDEDWETEKQLIMAEASVNANYHQYGFDMVTTFVETRDRLEIPNHYKIVKK